MNLFHIGQHKTDLLLTEDRAHWTDNPFMALKLEETDATLLSHEMKAQGLEVYTEPVLITAQRMDLVTKGVE